MKLDRGIFAVVGVIALWTTLAMWREAAMIHVEQAEKQALRHYATLASESAEALHPVRWGDRILVPKRQNDQREFAETYLAANAPLEQVWLYGGDVLGRVPTACFHGAFAFAAGMLVAVNRSRSD